MTTFLENVHVLTKIYVKRCSVNKFYQILWEFLIEIQENFIENLRKF